MAKKVQTERATKITKHASKKPSAAVASAKTPATKIALLQSRLQQAEGASLNQIGQDFGWLPHTVRAAISGLRKAGFVVERQASEQSSVYRIIGSGAA